MPEFTEEQEKEIEKRVAQAKAEQSYTDSGVFAYKYALSRLQEVCDIYDEKTGQKVQNGMFDYEVFKTLNTEFYLFLERRGLIKIKREDETAAQPTADE